MDVTSGSRRRDGLFLALCFATLVAVGGLDLALARTGVSLPGHLPHRHARPLSLDDLTDGGLARQVEQQWLNRSYVGRGLMTRYNELSFRIARRTTPASWVGRHRWLFFPLRTRELRHRHWQQQRRYGNDVVARVNRVVQERGYDLVVVVVPDRARIHSAMAYGSSGMPQGKGASLPEIVAALGRREVPVVDVTAALATLRDGGGLPFYADDTHWTSAGAEAAARAVAAGLPATLRTSLTPGEGPPLYAVRWDLTAPSESSLVQRLGFEPGGELERRFRTVVPRARFDEAPLPPSTEGPVIYWSSSLGKWGSPQFFGNAVGRSVRARVVPGRRFWHALVEELERLRLSSTPAERQLIVWELAEHHWIARPDTRPYGFRLLRDYLEATGG